MYVQYTVKVHAPIRQSQVHSLHHWVSKFCNKAGVWELDAVVTATSNILCSKAHCAVLLLALEELSTHRNRLRKYTVTIPNPA